MEQSTKVRENRLRRMAERQGLALVKSRRRDPLALDYGRYGLVDPATNAWMTGGQGYELTLEQAEEWLTSGKARR